MGMIQSLSARKRLANEGRGMNLLRTPRNNDGIGGTNITHRRGDR